MMLVSAMLVGSTRPASGFLQNATHLVFPLHSRFLPPPLPQSIFLAQEYMPGGTLRELIAKQMSKSGGARLYDWNDVFRWAKGIAEGLQYLHEQSPAVVHRDLKPENIIFDGKNPRASSARIADFGLSKCIRSRAERESMAGVRCLERCAHRVARRGFRVSTRLGALGLEARAHAMCLQGVKRDVRCGVRWRGQ